MLLEVKAGIVQQSCQLTLESHEKHHAMGVMSDQSQAMAVHQVTVLAQ